MAVYLTFLRLHIFQFQIHPPSFYTPPRLFDLRTSNLQLSGSMCSLSVSIQLCESGRRIKVIFIELFRILISALLRYTHFHSQIHTYSYTRRWKRLVMTWYLVMSSKQNLHRRKRSTEKITIQLDIQNWSINKDIEGGSVCVIRSLWYTYPPI